MSAEYAVIGLGIFGRNVATSLAESGQSVLAIDADPDIVESLSSELEAVVCADATDEDALKELQIERVSCVVVAIGAESREASILVATLCIQLGIPRVVARALSELHARVLRAVGAHEVVSPEVEMGQRLARRLAHPNVLERLDLGDAHVLAEIQVPEGFSGKTLIELDIRRRFGVSVVAIKRGTFTHATIDGEEQLEGGDVMVVIGPDAAVERIAQLA